MTPMTTAYQNLTPYSTQAQNSLTTQAQNSLTTQAQTQIQSQNPSTTQSQNFLNSIFGTGTQIPSTTFPTMSINNPNITLAQTLGNNTSDALCPSADLNSEFKKYGIYGR